MVTREQIVSIARSYCGTPFRHQGRVKGLGLDCVGLPICVGRELGLTDFDYCKYGEQPLERYVLEECRRRLIEKPVAALEPGDVVCMAMPLRPCHVGIIGSRPELAGELTLIHAYNAHTRRVVEHHLSDVWRRRIVAAFSYPGV